MSLATGVQGSGRSATKGCGGCDGVAQFGITDDHGRGRLSAADLVAQFQTVRAMVEDVTSQARSVLDEAYQLVQEATAHGWEGLATAAQAAHDHLEAALASLESAQSSADTAVSGVADIGSLVTVEQVADRLAAVLGETGDLLSALDATSASAGEADTWSRQVEATQLTDMIGGLAQAVGTARQSAVDAKDAVEKEHQEAVAWGTRNTGGPTAPPARMANRWPGYPTLAAVPLSWSDRMHILYGDELNPRSGGHLYGVNRPGKTEFPRDWDEGMIAREVADVARRPDRTPVEQFNGTWVASGVRRGVRIEVVVRPDGTVITGYPVDGAGVRRNPE